MLKRGGGEGTTSFGVVLIQELDVLAMVRGEINNPSLNTISPYYTMRF